MSKGTVFDIQRFSLGDGPGIRTTVFLKGCPLRCAWCHNPEGLEREIRLWNVAGRCVGCGRCIAVCPRGALAMTPDGKVAVDRALCSACGRCVAECGRGAMALDGFEIGEEELAARLLADRDFYAASGGGVTFSGGEPLLQAEFVGRMATRLKAAGIATVVETSLAVPWENIQKVAPVVDTFLVDLKFVNTDLHRKATGSDNLTILSNFQLLTDVLREDRLVVRLTLVPGQTATRENVKTVAWLIASLAPDSTLELLNFNPLAAAKYRGMRDDGYAFYQARAFTDEEMEEFRKAAGRLVAVV